MKKYFKDWGNYLSFALALFPTILFYVFPPGFKVPYFAFSVLLILFILAAWLDIKFFLDSKDEHTSSIDLLRCTNGKCLCRPNNFLTHNSIVSFYIDLEGFEQLISYGFVETITNKGMAQIVLIEGDYPHMENSFEYIASNQSRIIIKPTITTDTVRNLSKSL